MNFNVFWEALGGPRVIQNASKNDAKNHQKKGWKNRDASHAGHAGFSAGGGGFPLRSLQEAGQGQGIRPQGSRKPG